MSISATLTTPGVLNLLSAWCVLHFRRKLAQSVNSSFVLLIRNSILVKSKDSSPPCSLTCSFVEDGSLRTQCCDSSSPDCGSTQMVATKTNATAQKQSMVLDASDIPRLELFFNRRTMQGSLLAVCRTAAVADPLRCQIPKQGNLID